MTGAQLITDERREQLVLHKRTIANDVATNKHGELVAAAARLTMMVWGYKNDDDLLPPWPKHWDKVICAKMDQKTDFEKIQIAGAFLAADLDRRMANGCGPGKAYDEFTQACRPLIEYLANNHHPHTTAIVTNTHGQLVEGLKTTGEISDYIKH